jgi:hypothetical protein
LLFFAIIIQINILNHKLPLEQRVAVAHHPAFIIVLTDWIGVINDLPLLLQFFDVRIQTHLADGADGGSADFQRYPLTGFRHKKALRLQIGQEPTLGLAIGVRDVIARKRPFARQITYFWHDCSIFVLF